MTYKCPQCDFTSHEKGNCSVHNVALVEVVEKAPETPATETPKAPEAPAAGTPEIKS